jgi:hypothetical protein
MTLSKLDAAQIVKYTFDEEAQAQRVTIMPTEMSFSAESKTIAQADGVVSCEGYAYVCLFGTGTVTVSAETDNSNSVTLTLVAGTPLLICANTIKIVGTGKIVIRGS